MKNDRQTDRQIDRQTDAHTQTHEREAQRQTDEKLSFIVDHRIKIVNLKSKIGE